MDKAVIHTRAFGKAIPPGHSGDHAAILDAWPRWSLGIRTANFLFLSGTGGTNPDGEALFTDDPRRQVQVALDRLVGVIEAGGGRVQDLAIVRVFLDDRRHFDGLAAGLGEYFAAHLPGAYPACTVVLANTSEPALHAEVEAIAATSHESVHCPEVFGALAASAPWREFAHAVRIGNLWFCAGQLPYDRGGRVLGGTAAEQADAAIRHLEAVLAACGRSPRDLVRLTTWIGALEAVPEVERRVGSYLERTFPTGDYPAATTLVAPLPMADALVMLEGVATSGERQIVTLADGSPGGLRPGPIPYVPAVKVALASETGSFLQRFTWPDHPLDLDPALLASARSTRHPLGHLVFLSAQAGLGPDGSPLEGMTRQSEQVFDNMRRVVEAAGGRFADLVQFDVYYADRALYADYNAVRIRYLEDHNPDKEWFAGSGPKARSPRAGALLEIESIAAMA